MGRKAKAPLVDDKGLHLPEGGIIELGTPDWLEWLETANSFRFECMASTEIEGTRFSRDLAVGFTAFRTGSSKEYWNAQKRVDRVLRNEYLGRHDEITYELLKSTALKISDKHYWERRKTQRGVFIKSAPENCKTIQTTQSAPENCKTIQTTQSAPENCKTIQTTQSAPENCKTIQTTQSACTTEGGSTETTNAVRQWCVFARHNDGKLQFMGGYWTKGDAEAQMHKARREHHRSESIGDKPYIGPPPTYEVREMLLAPVGLYNHSPTCITEAQETKVAELEASLTVLRNSVEPLRRENERLREQIAEYRKKLEDSIREAAAEIERLQSSSNSPDLEQIRDRILLSHPPKERRKLKTVLDQFIRQCAT